MLSFLWLLYALKLLFASSNYISCTDDTVTWISMYSTCPDYPQVSPLGNVWVLRHGYNNIITVFIYIYTCFYIAWVSALIWLFWHILMLWNAFFVCNYIGLNFKLQGFLGCFFYCRGLSYLHLPTNVQVLRIVGVRRHVEYIHVILGIKWSTIQSKLYTQMHDPIFKSLQINLHYELCNSSIKLKCICQLNWARTCI